MIKKLLSLAVIACFSSSMAQNIELRNHNGTALINSTAITLVDTLENDNNQDIAVEIDATSKFSSSTNIKVKRYELTTTSPLSENAICWGVCTINILWGTKPLDTTDQVPMNLNQKVIFSGHVYPRLKAGTTVFKYVWYDVTNPNDSAWVDVTFDIRNPNAVGIEELKISKANASELKAHKSSIEPPPLQRIIVSTSFLVFAMFIALIIPSGAASP
jgi:hypothetical protein